MISGFSRNILDTFQVRKKRKDKDRFIELLRERFPELTVEEDRRPFRTKNIVIGDTDDAKVVLTAHYDTCARLLVPNFITPRNIPLFMAYQLGIGLLLGLLLGGTISVLSRYTVARIFGDGIVTWLLTMAMMVYALLWLIVLGPANRHTANDNTSGVITLITLLENMAPEERKKCAFVFFDLEEAGLWGSKAFFRRHREVMKEKLVLNFDCVSDGDWCMIIEPEKVIPVHDERLRKCFPAESGITPLFHPTKGTAYPSDQKNFPCGTAVAFFKKKRLIGYYMDRIHTSKDTVFEERNIDYLERCVRSFVSEL